MVQELRKKEADKLEIAGVVRKTAVRGGPPAASPRKRQLQPTKASLPKPSSGFQMTIPAIH